MCTTQKYGGKGRYAKKQGKRSNKNRKQQQQADRRFAVQQSPQNPTNVQQAALSAHQVLMNGLSILNDMKVELAGAKQELNDSRAVLLKSEQVLKGTKDIIAELQQIAQEVPVQSTGETVAPQPKEQLQHFIKVSLYFGGNSSTGVIRTVFHALNDYRQFYYEQLIQEVSRGEHMNAGATLSDLEGIDAFLLEVGLELTKAANYNRRFALSTDLMTVTKSNEIDQRSFSTRIEQIIEEGRLAE